jgi:hypothetical protein
MLCNLPHISTRASVPIVRLPVEKTLGDSQSGEQLESAC